MTHCNHLRAGFLAMMIASLFALVLAVPVFGQQAATATIEGIVTDQNNAVVPGAKVTVKNVDTGLTREITTDSSGIYRITALPPEPIKSPPAAGLRRKQIQLGHADGRPETQSRSRAARERQRGGRDHLAGASARNHAHQRLRLGRRTAGSLAAGQRAQLPRFRHAHARRRARFDARRRPLVRRTARHVQQRPD